MGNVRDRFDELGLCKICALPLPRKATDSICSRRCASLAQKSAEIQGADEPLWRKKILDVLGQLQADSTICPGELSQQIFPGTEKPLSVFRPLIYQLAEEDRVVLSQKNVKVPWWKIRGPFRIRRS